MEGQLGSAGTSGPGSAPTVGGDGGAGARGGSGGDGGSGGSGGGGAGGTIWLQAPTIEFGANVTLNIRGGSFNVTNGVAGGEGRLIVNASTISGQPTVKHNGADFTLEEIAPPTITSVNSATFTAGLSGGFIIKTTGLPLPGISLEDGTLPDGIVFQDNGDGTAFLAGTPTSGGTFELTFKAANDKGSVTQVFTLTVKQAPAFTSVNSSTFEIGVFSSFDITTVGFPDPAISKLGTLPNGITFTDKGGGKATLEGTPTESGSFNLGFVASNGVEPTASQGFTLTVSRPPAITSDDSTTFIVGSAGSFLVTTTGFPLAVLNQSGTLPAGVSFTDNGNGTATLAGTPTENGVFSISFGAANGVAPGATQTFTLTVNQSPAFTSGASAAFTVGSPGSFRITTSGLPEVSSIVLTDGSLPDGITLTYHDDGTATLAGTPEAGSGGVYNLKFTASNGVTPAAVQSFTLTINQPPAITSGNAANFMVGAAGSFLVTTTGFPAAATISLAGLPAGLTLTNHGDGTATLAGTPAPGTSGVYNLQMVASNDIDPDAVQSFTLTVNAASAGSQVRLRWPTSFKNLGNQRFQAVFTITNLGKQAISGPIQLAWPSLPPGVTVVNSTSIASLAAGKSAKITVDFQ
ncbi:MAG: hypothetical protein JNM56_13755, partial [Planctomycetia bacterium]|nr:hypothetical protein [Planctomycetia bacterium]